MTRERIQTVYAAAAIAAGLLFILGAMITASDWGAKTALLLALATLLVGGGFGIYLLRKTHRLSAHISDLTDDYRQVVMRESDLRTQVGFLLREPVAALVREADVLITTSDQTTPEQQAGLTSIQSNAREIDHILVGLGDQATGGPTNTPNIATVVALDEEFFSVATHDTRTSATDFELAPARAWGDPAKVRQVLRTLVTLSTQTGGAQLTLQTAQRGGSATATVSGKGAILSDAALRALAEGYEQASDCTSDDGTFEAMQAARNLATSMDGSIAFVHAFGDSHIVLTLPAPDHLTTATGASESSAYSLSS